MRTLTIPTRIYLYFAVAVLILCAYLYIRLVLAERSAEDAEIARLEPELKAKGFVPPSGKAKLPKDVPKKARPVATVRGRVSFGPPATDHDPKPGADRESADHPPVPPDRGSSASGCSITPNDLAGGCQAEIVSLDGKPYARLLWDGMVRLPDDTIVTRGPERVNEILLQWTNPKPPKRTLIGIDVGLVAAPAGLGYEIGGRVCPRAVASSWGSAEARLCGYARAEMLPGDVRGAVGASVMFGVGSRP